MIVLYKIQMWNIIFFNAWFYPKKIISKFFTFKLFILGT
jgi:hypothetical protein